MVSHISRDIHIGGENSRITQQGISRTRAQRDRAHRGLKFSRHTHPRRGRGKEVGDHSSKPPERRARRGPRGPKIPPPHAPPSWSREGGRRSLEQAARASS